MLELLITIVIGGVLMSVALPSFRSLLSDSQMVATSNEFVTSIQIARSEAIKRGTFAGLCPSTAPGSASAVCATGTGWTAGWIVFADDNGNGQRDAGEDLVGQKDARSNGFTFTPDAVFGSLIYFNSDGGVVNTSATPVSGDVAIKYGDEERQVKISASGRISTVTP